jgi:hypothetical protein
MKELIVMYGPPGSGKTTGLERFFSLNNARKKHIVHLCVDDFVYNSAAYAHDYGKLSARDRTKKEPMRDLFVAHYEKGQADFEHAIMDSLTLGLSPLAIDLTGRDFSWLEQFVKTVKKKRYRIDIVYPYVNCVTELMDRLFARFKDPSSRQTPAPKELVNAILEVAPKELNQIITLFKTSVKSLTVIDNSSRSSAYYNQVMFQYKDNTCQFFSLVFKPCRLEH